MMVTTAPPPAVPSAFPVGSIADPIAPLEPEAKTTPQVVRSAQETRIAAAPFVLNAELDRPFVSTTTTKKPTERPTPQPAPHDLGWLYAHRYDAHPLGDDNTHDLAWLYAHRFDVRSGEDFRVPGVPVKSQAASPFDTHSGAFHGVRSRNGWSAVRADVSIPCGASLFAKGTGRNELTGLTSLIDQETGYIYVGGWGAGPNGAAVDAALQKSSAQAESDE
jgi:hypothetical protein